MPSKSPFTGSIKQLYWSRYRFYCLISNVGERVNRSCRQKWDSKECFQFVTIAQRIHAMSLKNLRRIHLFVLHTEVLFQINTFLLMSGKRQSRWDDRKIFRIYHSVIPSGFILWFAHIRGLHSVSPPACTLTSLRDYHFTDSNNLITTLKLQHNRQKNCKWTTWTKKGQVETAAVSE